MKWIEVKVTTTPEASEAVSGIMYEMGVGGLYIEDPRDILEEKKLPTDWDYIEDELKNMDPNRVIIKAYLSEETNVSEKMVLLREKLNNTAKYFDIGEGKLELSEVFEKDWANNWKKYYKPVKVSDRVVIKPTWEDYQPSDQDEIVIEMDPGMAFGTGTHETTKMCIQLLEKYIDPDMDMLDIGCGSGILGIAGLKLGARWCTSVDIDENAVRVSGENASANHVDSKMTIKAGNLLDVITDKYDIIVANIIADAIISLSEIISPYLTEQGVFIASGIIKDRYEEVKEALLSNAFTVVDELFMGEWVAVAVKKV
ncbi:50S ribosomal protein L11 methyltransferase [Petroclostridium sp. X23]|uniref:50S ribosomal protein L11 methyltransferase n=1 Tax=Petroclostridium sp. X23 TaxID=3045146 RepID=UPI0024AE00C4|nr:50S ribosomal protein L11 methyltransferase [Petroclostridium sp. X23]WHH60425.1 50S ribosomal protein L11 methyltransferase [Petroclostridium sp. X23]